MKTADRFKMEIYEKRNIKLAQRKKRNRAALFCVPLALLVVCCSVFLPLLRRGVPVAGNGGAPYTLKAQPGKLLDLSVDALYRKFYSEDDGLDKENATEETMQDTEKEMERAQEEMEKEMALLQQMAADCRIEPEFSQAVNGFARDLTPLVFEDLGENGCWSPLSAYYAFALTGAGAIGKTEQEFLEMLHAPAMNWVSDQCEKYYRQHYHENDGSTFTLANSLWLEGRRGYRNGFLETAKSKFYATLFEADFTNPDINGEIGGWVSENTGGLINPEFQLDPETVLAILNTVYFKAAWTDEFYGENNTEDDFTKSDGSTVTAEFMHRGSSQDVYFGENFTRASLPLEDGAEMVFILPDEGVTPQELLQDSEAFEKMFCPLNSEDTEYCQVEWSVPKFSMDSEFDLKDAFSSVLPTAFDPVLADLTGISPKADLYIDQVKHGAHIAIDEQGVEAAAYTAIAMSGGAMPPAEIVKMDLNRPFLFAVTSNDSTVDQAESDSANASILFVGVCGDPTAGGSPAAGGKAAAMN